MAGEQFTFKQFIIRQDRCGMKVGTDGVLLGAWASGGRRILDVGTGTGLIALMMAQRFPDAEVYGIDLDTEAVEQARENVRASVFAPRVNIVHAAVQDYADGTFDAIVSNPPYFEHSLKNPDKQRAVARHTDTLSYRDLIQAANRLLSADGHLSLVLPTDVLSSVESECAIYGFFSTIRLFIKTNSLKQPKRVLLEVSRNPVSYHEEIVCLMDDGNHRSEWYDGLTKDFYIK